MSYGAVNYRPQQYNYNIPQGVNNNQRSVQQPSAFDDILAQPEQVPSAGAQQTPSKGYSLNTTTASDNVGNIETVKPSKTKTKKKGTSKKSDDVSSLSEELTVNIPIPNNAVSPTKWNSSTRGKTIRGSQLLLNGDIGAAKSSVFIGNIWYRVTMVVCLIVLAICVVIAGDYAIGVYTSERQFDDITALYTVSVESVGEDGETTEEDTSGLPPIVDWEGLSAINSELSGWIRIPGSTIDYPVLTSTVQDKYLTTNFYGNYSGSGCIFTDYENNGDDLTSDSHIIIYGHHMSTATMFHDLEYYLDENWFNEHQVIYFETEETTYVLRPIAAYTVLATEYDTRRVTFGSEVDFQTYLDERLERATSGYVVDDYNRLTVDKLFTLITCDSSTVENDRVVVECIVEQEYPTSMIPSVIAGARETGTISTTTSE